MEVEVEDLAIVKVGIKNLKVIEIEIVDFRRHMSRNRGPRGL